MSEMDIDIYRQCRDWEAIDGLEALVRAAARAAAEAVPAASGDAARLEVSLLLTSDREIAALNAAYRGRKGATNVLSFPQAIPAEAEADAGGPEPARLLGDIVLAYETIECEAREAGKVMKEHIAHLVVHGMLHLFGYDHEEDAEAEEMEGLETRILGGLGIADPYGCEANGAEAASLAAAGTEK